MCPPTPVPLTVPHAGSWVSILVGMQLLISSAFCSCFLDQEEDEMGSIWNVGQLILEERHQRRLKNSIVDAALPRSQAGRQGKKTGPSERESYLQSGQNCSP